MAHHTLSDAPQELVDLVLGETDRDTLKSCALVARSFRPTSQRLIFSDLTILPPTRDSTLTLQRLADVLSASPHLALHVRTLHLVQPYFDRCAWMESDILPAILSMFTGLESLNIRIYNWEYLHSNCEQAIYALITRSSLSSIVLQEARLRTSARLETLLGCFPASLESASFLNVFPARDDQKTASVELHQLRLASLRLDSYSPALLHWAIRAVDPKCLRHLHTIVGPDTLHDVQELLDSAVCVETYNLSFQSVFSHDESPNLEKMQVLRTLEISVTLDWRKIGGQGQHNPLNDVMRTLDTAPHTVEHLILNLNSHNPDELFDFMESPSLEHLGEGLPALRDVVVRLVSRKQVNYWEGSRLHNGVQYLKAVFYRLQYKGMLTVIAVDPHGGGRGIPAIFR
ncbi:hypothetical protein C8F04DRAFT_1251684 [Mycena alexandri]|uniref:F-box domain-containing protein n=1 Tax=Mycena alexandri TaxID=1745969 RepID=A0AAD6TD49_9AGAR|nr:hypothetical protein C8F04DRAFT_1251684 [Mycena alexandri]